MKNKKLTFTFIGLAIFVGFGVGFLITGFNEAITWGSLLTNISLLIGLFAHNNGKEKRMHLAKSLEDKK